jgi:hypothetical protein
VERVGGSRFRRSARAESGWNRELDGKQEAVVHWRMGSSGWPFYRRLGRERRGWGGSGQVRGGRGA